jgi:hypothetical protein
MLQEVSGRNPLSNQAPVEIRNGNQYGIDLVALGGFAKVF